MGIEPRAISEDRDQLRVGGLLMTKPSENLGNATSPAEVRIETVRWNGTGRVALIGEIDISNVADAETTLSDLASRETALTLDLLGLSYLDSQGVGMLFRLAKHAGLNGGTLTLANPRGIVRRVLDITNVAKVATVTDDV
jgi:anti-sigma B factor antagonist